MTAQESLSSDPKSMESEEVTRSNEVQKLFDFSNNLLEKFTNSDDLKKRELLSVLSSNLSLLDKNLNISFQKPKNYLTELKKNRK